MANFLEELAKRGEDAIAGDMFDLLASLGDFETFKQQMLDTKKVGTSVAGADLAIAGAAVKVHSDEVEDGEERPDLSDLLVVSPASPSGGKAKP